MYASAKGRYIEFCKATVDRGFNLSGLRIVLDCANGATYHVAPRVFEELGADLITFGNKPNGTNINDGVGSTHPHFLAAKVAEYRADLGIAFDGDGDRVIMVDADGNVVDGDQLLYVMAAHRKASNRLAGGVVGTVMSNFGLERALTDQGIEFVRAAVGDRYVLEQLRKRQWEIGGESSGHLLALDLTTTGDAIVSALQVLVPMVAQDRSLAELVSGMQKMPQTMVNVAIDSPKQVACSGAVTAAVADQDQKLTGRGRVLIRPSGTEPVVRVMVEGEDPGEVAHIAEQLADVVRTAKV